MKRFFFGRLFFLPWTLLLSLVGTASATDTSAEKETVSWYTINIDDQNAGWVQLTEQRENGQIITEAEQKMRFRRGQTEVEVKLASRFVERTDATPVSAWTRQTLGGQDRQTFYDFTEAEILIRSSADGPIERRVPTPKLPWMTPSQSQQRLLKALANDETAFSLRTVDPSFGAEPVDIDWKRLKTNVDVWTAGRAWKTSQWEQRQSWAPELVTVVYLDAEGQMVRNETELFGIKVVQSLADGDPSESPQEAPEMLISTFARPDRTIDRPRQVRRASFELSTPKKLPPLPKTSVQAVEQEGSLARVRIDLTRPTAIEIDPAAYLKANAYHDHRDPAVQSLLSQLSQTESASRTEIAMALRRLVHDSLESKDLNSVFDTASEVAINRSGDCTEHSVLLTALLRGAGIPARSVVGLIYTDQFLGSRDIFVYHMWSQAWLEGRWVDLDATLVDLSFDATHIALQIVSLDDDQAMMRELAGLIPLMGELKIRVLETIYE